MYCFYLPDSEGRIPWKVVSLGLSLDLADHGGSKLPVAVLDLFRSEIAQQFGFDNLLGRVGIEDFADAGSSLSVTNIDLHGNAVGRSVLDGSVERLGRSEGLGGGGHKGGKGEGTNDLHLDGIYCRL